MATSKDIIRNLSGKVANMQRFVQRDLPRIVGKEAVDLFKSNFDKEGFQDGTLEPWPDVKRRDPSSKWYGFDYKGEHRTSLTFTRDKKTGKTRRADKQKKLNFSISATKRKILNGSTHELQRSLRYAPTANGVIITSDKPYAKVQNEGGFVKVFGKGSARLPQRKFVGDSKTLEDIITAKAGAAIDAILNND